MSYVNFPLGLQLVWEDVLTIMRYLKAGGIFAHLTVYELGSWL